MNENFTPPGPLNTAVLFLVFNRPDTTAKVFEAIRQARPPRLYVAADGPREGREGEAERVARVREIATAVDWPCEVKTLFREGNFGCERAVSQAITWFFKNEPYGIILEDDCLPSQKFFFFSEYLLRYYEFDTRIGMVAGTQMVPGGFNSNYSYAFSRLIQIWGWATWRRAWEAYDVDMEDWPVFKRSKGMARLGINRVLESYLTDAFEKSYEKRIDTWDYQWSYACVKNGYLTAFPSKNLIENIGFSEGATHTATPPKIEIRLEESEFGEEIKPPPFMIPDTVYDLKKIGVTGFLGGTHFFVRRGVLKLIGRAFG